MPKGYLAFLFLRSFCGIELLERASGQGGEEEPGEARWQEVAGDGPGHEERHSRRMVGTFYEA